MKKQAILTLVVMVGFAVALLASGQHAYAQENPLLDRNFWETATVEDVRAAIDEGKDVQARIRIDRTPLHEAARWNDNPDVIKLLLDRGADIQALNMEGWTPLHMAAETNNPDVVSLLLDRGADIEARDGYYGCTPLHWAAWTNQNPAVVELLLDRGADASANTRGSTPFFLCQ